MPLLARLVDPGAGAGGHHVVAEQRAEGALDHVGVLVLVVVAVERRGQGVRRHRVVDDGEAAAMMLRETGTILGREILLAEWDRL